MVGLIAMFGGFAVYQRGGVRLRAARDAEQVRSWLGLLESTNPMFASGSVMLLISGIYMMASRWRAPLPWIVVAIIGLLTISIVGATVSGRHLRQIRALLGEGRGAVSRELTERIADPFAWTAVAAVNGLAIGIVFIMSTKPGWVAAIGIATVTAALGALVGARVARRGAQQPEPSAQVTAS
jgi:hypothetical protein